MIIGIDYDSTWTESPSFFRQLVYLARDYGHEIIVVTGRGQEDHDEVGRVVNVDLRRNPVPIICAGLKWKRQAALDAGYNIDIWIDDDPEHVGPQETQDMLRHQFNVLTRKWKKETGSMSNLTLKCVENKTYQAIIALGKPVIPLIAEEMGREIDDWFIALYLILGEGPDAHTSHAGDRSLNTEWWLRFLREKGFSW